MIKKVTITSAMYAYPFPEMIITIVEIIPALIIRFDKRSKIWNHFE